MLAEHERIRRTTDLLGSHDLVGQLVFEHAVLVDPGFVREGVLAHDRLVDRHADPGHLREQAARAIDLFHADARLQTEVVATGVERHHHLLPGGVSGALTDSVDRALDLPRTTAHRGERVRDCHAEIVVVVRAPGHPLAPRHVGPQPGEEGLQLLGDRVAGRVRDVAHGGTGADRLGEDLAQVIAVAARGVLGRKLDVADVLARELDRPPRRLDHLGPAHHELVLQVDVGGRDEDVEARVRSLLDRPCGTQDVGLLGSGEREHDGPGNSCGDRLDRGEIAVARGRETGLDDVHAEFLELAGER